MEWVEVTGVTLDEARERALDRLGVDASDAEIEVLTEASRSLMGLRKVEARVRARVRPTAPPPRQERNDRRRGAKRSSGASRSGGGRSQDRSRSKSGAGAERSRSDPKRKAPSGNGSRSSKSAGSNSKKSTRSESPDQPTQQGANGPAPRRRSRRLSSPSSSPPPSRSSNVSEAVVVTDSTRRVRRLSGPANESKILSTEKNSSNAQENTVTEDVSVEDQGAMVVEFLDGLMEAFGLEGSPGIAGSDEDSVDVAISGDSLGLLIGPGGHTLAALTEVTKTVLQRQNGGSGRARVRLDVAGYRERRRAALDVFAREVADTVKSSGEAKALEPMHSADRKVVHDTIGEVDGVGTVSDGDEPRRRVVVVPEG